MYTINTLTTINNKLQILEALTGMDIGQAINLYLESKTGKEDLFKTLPLDYQANANEIDLTYLRGHHAESIISSVFNEGEAKVINIPGMEETVLSKYETFTAAILKDEIAGNVNVNEESVLKLCLSIVCHIAIDSKTERLYSSLKENFPEYFPNN